MPRDPKGKQGRDSKRDGKRGDKKAWMRKPRTKACPFCKDNTEWVDYKDTQLLRKFLSDRGKIRARRVTGACTQHQRDIASAIKNAREMSLLPYMSK
jgi:small subunit ribosomal protein S18